MADDKSEIINAIEGALTPPEDKSEIITAIDDALTPPTSPEVKPAEIKIADEPLEDYSSIAS